MVETFVDFRGPMRESDKSEERTSLATNGCELIEGGIIYVT